MKILTIPSILYFGLFLTVSAQEPRIGHFAYMRPEPGIHSELGPTIRASDKKGVYKRILRDYFGEIAKRGDKTIEVKLILGSVPAELLPDLPNVKFLIVSEDETKAFSESESGGEFYAITVTDEPPPGL